jgi:DNA processing protein
VLDLDKVVPRVEEDFVLQEKLGTRMLLPGGPDWPRLLDTCVNPPVLLHVLGNPEVLRRPAPLALVGSRQAVQYGSRVAASFASAWARMGGVVVSGGAIGVDTAAHEGCLAAGGSTVAIMGTGLAELHPRRNQALFSAISETGAIASELPMRSRAMPFNFPLRNRLIAALSKAVVVVQARRDSGALHTAHFALKSGRLLFTVPAPVDEESCLGGLDLLVQGVPAMVGTAQLQGLFAQMTGSPSASPRLPLEPGRRIVVRLSDLAPAERNVLELVVQGTCHVDDLLAAGGMEGRELSLALLSLEMRGWVEKAPGNRYISSVRLER